MTTVRFVKYMEYEIKLINVTALLIFGKRNSFQFVKKGKEINTISDLIIGSQTMEYSLMLLGFLNFK
jgi:hypothetical protein